MKIEKINIISAKEVLDASLQLQILSSEEYITTIEAKNPVTGKNIDIKVYQNRKYLRYLCTAICGTIKNSQNEYSMIVDNFFFDLPTECQEVLIHHEIGHVLNTEYNKLSIQDVTRLNALKNCNLSDKAMELDFNADRFAVKLTCKEAVIYTLKYLYNHYSVNRRDILSRIYNLNRNEMEEN